jgi:serine/threonine-protein kinase
LATAAEKLTVAEAPPADPGLHRNQPSPIPPTRNTAPEPRVLTPVPATQSARFSAGAMLAGRYQIITALGKGGMGEVYRAEDLLLAHPVAIKFLPEELARDADLLRRFRKEVRIAREVSHPNVCRVHDIGEVDGQSFLTMEYIDGEDLAALLKKVGRLPEDKGLELARQLCQGLAAAHDKGVIHRDLKPRNIMIDAQGHVRITDFGLAVFAEDVQLTALHAGTPAYMAPEQLAGKEVSVQSDLFALGLILYELFTGKRAFQARSREELARLYAEGLPSKPSSHVTAIDPAVERVILRCLEKAPKDRPASARAVLAALPGGDPLAAAIAAGEVPSPQTVANAKVEGTLHTGVALALLASVLLGIVLIALLNNWTRLFRQVPQELSSAELTIRARAIVRELGYLDPPRDSAVGIAEHADTVTFLRERYSADKRWADLDTGEPAAMYFWYRQSPQLLVQKGAEMLLGSQVVPGRVTLTEPPMIVPGMMSVCLDLKGRLIQFHAVPPRQAEHGPAAAPDWQTLYRQAGLDLSSFTKTAPICNPPVHSDAQMAWQGVYPERPDIAIQVEAAGYRGRPVFFHVGPVDRPEGLYDSPSDTSAWNRAWEHIVAAVIVVIFTAGAWLAWHNVRLGRANARGALWLAAFHFSAYMICWVFLAKHVPSVGDEFVLVASMLGLALVTAGQLWLAYLAIEPYVRRRWPWWVVSWNRLLEGRVRDPLVGRDILIGSLVGIVWILLVQSGILVFRALGWGLVGRGLLADPFTTHPFVSVSFSVVLTVLPGMTDFFLLFVLCLILRRQWLGFAAYIVVQVLPGVLSAEHTLFQAPAYALWTAFVLFILWRFGFLVYVVGGFFFMSLYLLPLTTDLGAWYFTENLIPLLVLVGLSVYGFVISLGGRPLLRDVLLQGAPAAGPGGGY